MGVESIKRELVRLRHELIFIEGQLDNETWMESADLGSLSLNEIAKLREKNEKLMAEIIVLETMLEE